MKTKLKFKELGIIMVILFSTFIFSCTKEIPIDVPESDLTLKSAAVPQPDDMVCDLIAGQQINVGKVVYSHIGNNLLVEYITTGGWNLSEVHLYVGNMADFKATCMNNTAVKIGQFPYSATNLNSTTKSFKIDLTGIVPDASGYLVVAHAVVNKSGQEETAFANCTYKPVIAAKALFSNDIYGESEGTRFSNDPADWCYWLGTNIYEKNDVYTLGSYGNTYGEVDVTDDGISLFITLTAKENLLLTHAWVYVGSMNGLNSFLNPASYGGKCPEYWNFPLIMRDIDNVSHTFSMPMLSSISFQDGFNSNRWGWYSYYKF